MTQARVQAGVPTGGQFSTQGHAEANVTIDSDSGIDWGKEDAYASAELNSLSADHKARFEASKRIALKSLRLAARSIQLQYPDAKYLRVECAEDGQSVSFDDALDADGNRLGLDTYEPLANGVDLGDIGYELDAGSGEQPGTGTYWDVLRTRKVGGKTPDDLAWASYVDLDKAAAITDEEIGVSAEPKRDPISAREV